MIFLLIAVFCAFILSYLAGWEIVIRLFVLWLMAYCVALLIYAKHHNDLDNT